MARGSYFGGGTLIGSGKSWSDWRDFPCAAVSKDNAGKARKKKRKVRKAKVGERTLREKTTNPLEALRALELRAKMLPLTQDDVLAGFGHPTKKLVGVGKAAVLKALVLETVLLATGLPNPDHPKVRALLDLKLRR